MVKLNYDQLGWAMADRAAQAATASGDALAVADAHRSVATVMRRTGRPDKAHALLIDTADEIAPARNASPEQLSMYGTLLQVAAYTAAVDGDRPQAGELIGAAQGAATRLGRDANYRHTAFGPTNVALYQVSIAQVLGDNGTGCVSGSWRAWRSGGGTRFGSEQRSTAAPGGSRVRRCRCCMVCLRQREGGAEAGGGPVVVKLRQGRRAVG